jgi:hypothetical protein
LGANKLRLCFPFLFFCFFYLFFVLVRTCVLVFFFRALVPLLMGIDGQTGSPFSLRCGNLRVFGVSVCSSVL